MVTMISFGLPPGPLSIVCLGAHPDDVEIGSGGTLLTLAASRSLTVDYVLMTGTEPRQGEARDAARKFMVGADIDYHLYDLPDGRLPEVWGDVKQRLEEVAKLRRADLVFAPRVDDAHQDHRLIAELATTVWRDALILHYEIPKWDGDLGQVTHYVALSEDLVQRKVDLLMSGFPSQVEREWWDHETFSSILRLRGVECRNRYAEGFVVTKAVIALEAG
jgi:LmbE family N-acetylglucosaminyl deacetylase